MSEATKQCKPISVGNWIIMIIISFIPLINIIVMLIWAFGNNSHPSEANYAKANLILIAITSLFTLCCYSL